VIHFTRLRLSGFKSFVEPKELFIEPGLTGIVGPNGCGKSNLVEALRWVMGENSAKQMRGDEMDDVIFGGTSQRPARNLSEVCLFLDNSERSAPTQFNESDELEIVRRIERGQGSHYKINGRECRARDVQTLFADAASGARSAAIVSQGKIGSIISAKPSDRRIILEDAAGIAGLHSRRQEAELRLKASKDNLERLLDIFNELNRRLHLLDKQALQAKLYRELSSEIRLIEAKLFRSRWLQAQLASEKAQKDSFAHSSQIDKLMEDVAQSILDENKCAEALPEIRRKENEITAHYHQLSAQKDNLEQEEKRLFETQTNLTQQLSSIDLDIEREKTVIEDATKTLALVESDQKNLAKLHDNFDDLMHHYHEDLAKVSDTHSRAEEALSEAISHQASHEAEKINTKKNLTEHSSRLEKLETRYQEIMRQKESLNHENSSSPILIKLDRDLEEARLKLSHCQRLVQEAELEKTSAEQDRENARNQLHHSLGFHNRLIAEAEILQEHLLAHDTVQHSSLFNLVSVQEGFEIALGVALGDSLSGSLAPDSSHYWTELPPLDPPLSLPGEVQSLSHFVSAPPHLSRRLSQVGLVETYDLGKNLHSLLKAGQSLVSKEGALWRWDGYHCQTGIDNHAAVQLKQKNRLYELVNELENSNKSLENAKDAAALADLHTEQKNIQEKQARDDLIMASDSMTEIQRQRQDFIQQNQIIEAKIASLLEQENLISHDLEDAKIAKMESLERLEILTKADQTSEKIEILKTDLSEKRNKLVDIQSKIDKLQRDYNERENRLKTTQNDKNNWLLRLENSKTHLHELLSRKEAITLELDNLATFPAELNALRLSFIDQISLAEQQKLKISDQLSEAETTLTKAKHVLKERETLLFQAREKKIRGDALCEQAQLNLETLRTRIHEKFESDPDSLLSDSQDEESYDHQKLEKSAENLLKRRTEMGPVNLLAESEADDIRKRIESLENERHDLESAIAQLHQVIRDINSDGKERLLKAFDEVNRHFSDLFVRLFGGGKAYLALTESDDPLQAGLEIMASPPGKKLQTLSLLSGGEQALTALALLFAVFMTNPAPICILDEVDAPLDDANVDLFCRMVHEISTTSRTRFLVITHHRMTMAHMDRLYGVTMAERGVSSLVSVDLSTYQDEDHLQQLDFAVPA
jgi:chromosome segregation protein